MARRPTLSFANHSTSTWRARRGVAAALAGLIALTPALARGEDTVALPEMTVKEQEERADGPVLGYRATRSGTFNKTDTPLKEVPASVTVVPGPLIKDQASASMADAIRYVPGVTQHQGEGNRDQFVIRGNSTTADFYVNGVRDDAQVFRDTYNLERIEVLKGPAGMVFGRGGAGGIINRVTKRPVFGPTFFAGSITGGQWEQFRISGDVGGTLGDSAAWRLNLIGEVSDSFRDDFDLETWAVNPALTLKLGEHTTLTLDYEHLYDRRTADRGIPSKDGGRFHTERSRFFGNPDQSHARSTVDGFSAVLDHDVGPAQLRNTFRVTHYDKFYQNVFPGSAVDAAGNVTLSAYNNANQRTNIFNQTDVTMAFATGPLGHKVLAGVELGYQDSHNKRNTGFFGNSTSIAVSAGHPFAVATRFAPSGTDADNDVNATVVGVYGQDEITLLQPLKLLVGVRYDYFHVDFDDHRRTTPAIDLDRTDNGVSPRAALIWTPIEPLSFYVAYSDAFLPSAEQLGLATTTADLGPEKARNYEIGARWDVLPTLSLAVALFRLDRDDVKVNDPTSPGTFVKTGQQRTEGVEFTVQGDVLPWWHVYGGSALLDGRITEPISTGTTANAASVVPSGNKIGLVPDHQVSLWNKVDLPYGFAVALGVIHQSSAFTSFTNAVKLPGFTRVDAAAYYTFLNGKMRLALNIENLGSTKYYPTADGDNNISPGAPINARLTLSGTF